MSIKMADKMAEKVYDQLEATEVQAKNSNICIIKRNGENKMARKIKGTVKDKITNEPIIGAKVKAYDSDVGSDDFMGEDTTDTNGRFEINYRGGHWDSGIHKVTTWRPDIYIKVYIKEGNNWIQSFKSRTYSNQKLRNDRTINVEIDTSRRTVEGRVTFRGSNKPAEGLLVRALDSDGLDKNDLMGEATTDDSGYYKIRYRGGHWDPSPTHGMTQWRPDIYISVFTKVQDNQLSRVYKSSVHSDHPLREKLTINAKVPKDEWFTKMTAFDPSIHGWPFDNDKFKVCGAPTCKDEHVGSVFRHILRFDWALCGGMSLGAARRFNRNMPVEPFSPTLKKQLVQYQLDTLLSGSAWWTFLEWQARPDFPHTLALHTIGHSTKNEWSKLKRYLDRGSPRVIGLIRVGPTNDPTEASANHQVLAIGYRMNNFTNEVEIKVYDPNYHGKTSTIYWNKGLLRNQINAIQKTPGEKDEPVRGFFVVNVSHR